MKLRPCNIGMEVLLYFMPLTHLPLVPHICISESDEHLLKSWLDAEWVPTHYLNHCWIIINCILRNLRNKLQWDFNQNTKSLIHENAFEIIVCERAAILSRGDEIPFTNLLKHKPVLIQLMAWCWLVGKPYSEPTPECSAFLWNHCLSGLL